MFSYHPSIFLSSTNLHNTLPIYNERVISQVKINYIQFLFSTYYGNEIYVILYLIRYITTQHCLVIGWKVGRHDIKLKLFYPDDERKG